MDAFEVTVWATHLTNKSKLKMGIARLRAVDTVAAGALAYQRLWDSALTATYQATYEVKPFSATPLQRAAAEHLRRVAASPGMDVSAQYDVDTTRYHVLTVLQDGQLSYEAYAGDAVLLDTELELLTWSQLGPLLDKCSELGLPF